MFSSDAFFYVATFTFKVIHSFPAPFLSHSFWTLTISFHGGRYNFKTFMDIPLDYADINDKILTLNILTKILCWMSTTKWSTKQLNWINIL